MAIGVLHVPVESDLTGSGVPVELFTDVDYGAWLRLRLALNQAQAETGGVTLTTTAVTLAYRYPFPVTETVSGEMLGGIAQLSGTLEAAGGAATLNASTVGLVAGVALHRAWAETVVSVEYQLIFGEADFEGLTVNLGSNQLLLGAAYRFY